MKLFNNAENRVRCGRCNTEFDIAKNKSGCPLCGFGKAVVPPIQQRQDASSLISSSDIIILPILSNLKSVKAKVTDENKTWGSWLMFNDFFAPKFICRALAFKMHNEKKEYVSLKELMAEVISSLNTYHLTNYKGFPNLHKDPHGARLVNHFLVTFYNMGLIDAKSDDKSSDNMWQEKWNRIFVTLTQEGYEFANLENNVLDHHAEEQVLTVKEKNWLIQYLTNVDAQGYKELSVLREVYGFLKEGHNGNSDLWTWFQNDIRFKEYIKRRSEKARKNPEIFQQQLVNYSKSFASAKISLLRELGVVKDKRNDYKIIGDL